MTPEELEEERNVPKTSAQIKAGLDAYVDSAVNAQKVLVEATRTVNRSRALNGFLLFQSIVMLVMGLVINMPLIGILFWAATGLWCLWRYKTAVDADKDIDRALEEYEKGMRAVNEKHTAPKA